jgi:hypothetical protein
MRLDPSSAHLLLSSDPPFIPGEELLITGRQAFVPNQRRTIRIQPNVKKKNTRVARDLCDEKVTQVNQSK